MIMGISQLHVPWFFMWLSGPNEVYLLCYFPEGTKKTVTKKAKRKITRNPAPVSVPSSDDDSSTRLKKRFKKKPTSEEGPLQIQASSLPSPSQVLDMPVDPNEPTYCLCEQVSYGEMIGCDNADVSLFFFPPLLI